MKRNIFRKTAAVTALTLTVAMTAGTVLPGLSYAATAETEQAAAADTGSSKASDDAAGDIKASAEEKKDRSAAADTEEETTASSNESDDSSSSLNDESTEAAEPEGAADRDSEEKDKGGTDAEESKASESGSIDASESESTAASESESEKETSTEGSAENESTAASEDESKTSSESGSGSSSSSGLIGNLISGLKDAVSNLLTGTGTAAVQLETETSAENNINLTALDGETDKNDASVRYVSDADEFDQAIKELPDGGKIILADDIELDSEDRTVTSDLTILGDGHTLNVTGRIIVDSSATIKLGDESGDNELTIDGTTDETSRFSIIELKKNCSLYMYDGVTIRNRTKYSDGGAVSSSWDNVSMHMLGGVISDCKGANGGAVYVSSKKSTFTMSGNSQITDCKATNGGGAICSGGETTIDGGTISGNTAKMEGGAIKLISSGKLTINDGIIKDNKSEKDGGAIYLPSSNTVINGGEITGNEAAKNGGAIGSTGMLTINGGEISQNKAGKAGGGIYFCTYNKLNTLDVGSDAKIYNNTAEEQGADISTSSNGSWKSISGFELEADYMGVEYQDSGEMIDGWYEDASAKRYIPEPSGTALTPSEIRSKRAIDLVASYAGNERVTITYEFAGSMVPHGVNAPDPDKIDKGTAYTAKTQAKEPWWGFDGWYTDEECTESFEDGTVIEEDTILYGRWEKTSSGDSDTRNRGSSAAGYTTSSADSKNKPVSGTWQKDSTGRYEYFTRTDGTQIKNSWAYLAAPDTTAAQNVNNWYRFDVNGDVVRGWYKDAGNGTSGDKWYYLDKNGGNMLTGWHYDNEDGRWYYLSPADGHMLTGWQQIGGKWYCFNSSAPAQTWVYNGSEWHFNDSAARPYGSMYAGEKTPDNYTVNADGAWMK